MKKNGRLLPLLLAVCCMATGGLQAESGTVPGGTRDTVRAAETRRAPQAAPAGRSAGQAGEDQGTENGTETETSGTAGDTPATTGGMENGPTPEGVRVYTFPIREEIMPAAQRLAQKCMKQARETGADIILIQMNTYGGMVDVADSIRTAILNSPVPVWVFVDNQAISAGALIAVAADSLYIRPGGSIGAASVVDQSGQPMPDKYQSFMRATMRATAEAHGKVIDRIEGRDTLWRWHRDPVVAEAMVGVATAGDSVRVLTLTADEAIARRYSEGKASTVEAVLREAGLTQYTLTEYRPTGMDRLLGFLMNPVVQGIFIMMIIGGIYFELQTPGIGFPLIVAVAGAVLYFAPLYVEGLVANWEIVLFAAGIILLLVEIFVLPGFGIAGIAGIIAMVLGLAFAAVDNELFRYVGSGELPVTYLLQPLLVVVIGVAAAFVAAFWLGKRFLTGKSRLRERVVLTADLAPKRGYATGFDKPMKELVGKHGVVSAVLRPSGKVIVEGEYYDAVAEDGLFLPTGTEVKITRVESGTLYCQKVE